MVPEGRRRRGAEINRSLEEGVNKPSVFVTSTGRTGTLFLAHLFDRILPDVLSCHEPDVINTRDIRDIMRKLSSFGPSLIWGKFHKKGNMRGLSDLRIARSISRSEAARRLRALRARFMGSRGQVYVECNNQFYGLIDVLPEAFPNSKVIYMIRDGREWVRSMMARTGGVHRRYEARNLVPGGLVTPRDVPGDPWGKRWDSLDHFSKNCWWWMALNGYALNSISKNPHARMWKFEDVFLGENRYECLRDLVDFASHFPDGTTVESASLEGTLQTRRNVSRGGPDHWTEWSPGWVAQFQRICGDFMSRLGYGFEREWQSKCSAARDAGLTGDQSEDAPACDAAHESRG